MHAHSRPPAQELGCITILLIKLDLSAKCPRGYCLLQSLFRGLSMYLCMGAVQGLSSVRTRGAQPLPVWVLGHFTCSAACEEQ